MLSNLSIISVIFSLLIAFLIVTFVAVVSYIDHLKQQIYELQDMNNDLAEALSDEINRDCNN